MRKTWEPDELIDAWTLVDVDWALVGNKSGGDASGFQLDVEVL